MSFLLDSSFLVSKEGCGDYRQKEPSMGLEPMTPPLPRACSTV
jgi:hypothetical protein